MATVKDFYEFLNGVAPFSTQEDWDNSGMLVGDFDAEVSTAIVVLDITTQAVEKAKELGADLIISHHPVIFHALKDLKKGSVPFELASNSINAICCHTPLDIADGGTNDTLAGLLGINTDKGENPILRFAEIEPTTADALAHRVSDALNAKVRYADAGKPITKIAICTGAGCSLLPEIGDSQAFITGDASHHDFLDAVQSGITLIAAGHYETEFPVVHVLREKLSERFKDILIIDIKQQNPIQYI
jgi:dinuclear metal center YbgI/SA1388 family protein